MRCPHAQAWSTPQQVKNEFLIDPHTFYVIQIRARSRVIGLTVSNATLVKNKLFFDPLIFSKLKITTIEIFKFEKVDSTKP